VNILLTSAWRHACDGGWLMVPIAGCCYGVWYFTLRTRLRLGALLREAAALTEATGGALDGRLSDAGWRRATRAQARLGGLLAAARRRVGAGSRVTPGVDESEEQKLGAWRRDIVLLRALTAAAPLLGLSGTVAGMVDTFRAVSAESGDLAADMAAGISRALITTQMGLVVAIAGVFGLAGVERRWRRVLAAYAGCKQHLLQWLAAGPETETSA
jgi:biopolymer transport protein ExbB